MWLLGLKIIKMVVARAEIPKKWWLLGLKFLKNVIARAEIPKNSGC